MLDVSDRFGVGSMSCSSRRKPVVYLLARRIWLVGLSSVPDLRRETISSGYEGRVETFSRRHIIILRRWDVWAIGEPVL